MCFLQASIGIAKLLMMAMKEQGLTEQQALSKIWMVDSKGLIVKVSALSCWFKEHGLLQTCMLCVVKNAHEGLPSDIAFTHVESKLMLSDDSKSTRT
jgi:hypothetical protein